jgi:hypothetical protein
LDDYHYITHDGYYEIWRSRSLNFYRILRRKLSASEMETLAPGHGGGGRMRKNNSLFVHYYTLNKTDLLV